MTIRRSYEYLDADSVKSLYTSLVRPHLEYGHTVWPLNYKTDRTLVENVQHRATKLVPALKDLEYTDRLKQLNLPSMAYRMMDERCFRPLLCTVKAELGRGQPGLMR